jgi:2-dehydro-3-deoxyphosphogluconate aldolase/(4S)-4-hydroxy-2-oxoglutarate aldolase
VELDNVAEFIRAGSAAVGVGSALIDQKLLDAGDFGMLTERSRRLIAEVQRGRGRI